MKYRVSYSKYLIILMYTAIIIGIIITLTELFKHNKKNNLSIIDKSHLVLLKHYTSRIKTLEYSDINTIPLDIYRTWNNKMIPIAMKEEIDRTRIMSPEFDNYFYSNEDNVKFIEMYFEPNVVKAYHCLKPLAFKADLWRYCVLYIKGGVYIDIKMELFQPLLPIIQKFPLLLVHDGGSTTQRPYICNGFIASPPGNIIFKGTIDAIVLNCKERRYNNHVLDVTGPHVLGRMVKKYVNQDIINNIPCNLRMIDDKINIFLYDTLLLREYDTYRDDQKRTNVGVKSYTEIYNEHDIFDKSIIFN